MQPVQSLTRALDILEFVARCEEGASLSDIVELLEVSQGAAYNLSNTLVARGYLSKSDRPVRFTIGDTLINLGLRQVESQLLRNIAGIMGELTEIYPTANMLFVRPLSYQLIVQFRVDPTQPQVIQRPMRVLEDPYSMITPVSLLAFLNAEDRGRILHRYPFEEFTNKGYPDVESFEAVLSTIRKQGYGMSMERLARAASPVYDAKGEIRGCLGISFNDAGSSQAKLMEALGVLQQKLQQASLLPHSA